LAFKYLLKKKKKFLLKIQRMFLNEIKEVEVEEEEKTIKNLYHI